MPSRHPYFPHDSLISVQSLYQRWTPVRRAEKDSGEGAAATFRNPLKIESSESRPVKMKTLKIIVIAGARPNFMKVAPLLRQLDKYNAAHSNGAPALKICLVHTGQHYDESMSQVFFRELGIRPPDINLGIGSGSHALQTAKIMTAFEPVCDHEKPDWVIVVGDVNSTMACTLVCSKIGIKVGHVEAGLRSFDRSMPEEVNRVITDSLADLLLTPSEDANDNLLKEGISKDKIKFVGNIMIDSLIENLEAARLRNTNDKLGCPAGEFVYVTLHRPSNVDSKESLCAIFHELKSLAQQMPVVFPMHPRTRKMITGFGITINENRNLKIIEPIGYHDSLCLTERARFVLTDSGGLQEESTYFRTPCLTLRPNTERPVTITSGSNQLTSINTLNGDIDTTLKKCPGFSEIPKLWDGGTSKRIVDWIVC